MSRCKTDTLMSKIGIDKVNKLQEVDFTVNTNLPDCRRINASKYVSGADDASYNRYKIPDNQFECLREGCINSGTLYNEGAETVYKAQYDATEFAAGVLTFYALMPVDGTATVKISDTQSFADADSYTVDLKAVPDGKDGFKAVVVDLSKEPTATIGEGWTPSSIGAYIFIEIKPTDEEADKSGIGISSISIFDDIADFETTAHVKIGCLTTVGGSWDLDAAEATCFGNGGYDEESLDSFEKTITGKALTPNWQLLNPLFGKGTAVEAWDNETVEKTVIADGDFGVVTLADKFDGECGFLSVALADSCNVTDAQLTELTVPTKVDVDEKHYIVIDNEDGSTSIYFNKEHVGAPVIISYPKTAEIEEWELNESNIGDRRVRLSYTRTQTDGVKWRFVFDNVLITSFPDEITDEESEFEFTITIQKDSNGRFGRAYRILS